MFRKNYNFEVISKYNLLKHNNVSIVKIHKPYL